MVVPEHDASGNTSGYEKTCRHLPALYLPAKTHQPLIRQIGSVGVYSVTMGARLPYPSAARLGA